MAQTIDKVAWILLRDRRVLFVRSKKEPLLFYTVGGKREPGETDHETLRREAVEETGAVLFPDTIEHLHTFEGPAHNSGEGARMTMACYMADYIGTPEPQSEIAETAWLSTDDMHRTTPMGHTILRWLNEHDLID